MVKMMQLVITSILLSVSLTACVSIGPARYTNVQTYNLAYNAPAPTSPAVNTGKTLMVNIGQAAPGFRGSNMIYQQTDYRLQDFALHRWVAPPVTMITPIIANALSDSGAFKAVVSAPIYAGSMDYQVSIDLQSLLQNFSANNTSVEQLILQVVVIDMKTNKAVAAKRFVAKVPAAPDPDAGVVAANQALAQVVPQVTQFVVDNVR